MLEITYEAGYNEPLHPDPVVNGRMEELDVSDCTNGCKIYWDPMSTLIVLGHNASYGCKRSKESIVNGE